MTIDKRYENVVCKKCGKVFYIRKSKNRIYCSNNCVPSCKLCNLGKLTQTHKEYIERCKKVYLNHKDKI